MFPSLAFLHAYPLTSMHTRRHMHTYIFCGPGLEECWVFLQPPPPTPPQEIRLHHTCPPHFIPFQSVPPKSCHIFIWAQWLWQICQMTHIHKHTHLWTHKGTQTEGGCSAQGGTRERWAPAIKPSEDEARVLPWTGQYFLPLCQDAVRTGSKRASDMNDIYKAAVWSHSKHSWKSAVDYLWWSYLICWVLTRTLWELI